MENRIAKILSALFHPLVMPLLSVYCLFSSSSYFLFRVHEKAIYVVYAIVFLFTFLLPAVTSLLLFRLGVMDNLESPARENRKIPYLLTAVYYTGAYYLLSKINLPAIIYLSVLGACFIIILTSIINIFWKISAHMIGIGGLVGALLGLSFRYMLDAGPYLVLAILAAGLLGFSRLKLNAHTPAQVYTGFSLGCAVQFLILSYI
jgi:hypothetical protein